jgi:hydroxymethylbilane synthase
MPRTIIAAFPLTGTLVHRCRPLALSPGPSFLQSAVFSIGTRGSPLALAQADEVRRRLADRGLATMAEIAIRPIRTTGDRIADRPLAEAGGKGLFTKEIDEALLAGEVDLAVHSAKDMPTRLPDGMVIAACLPRGDVRDAFLSPRATGFADLPQGAVVGTSSLRRAALALRTRPDLRIVNLRGNVETRLRKLADGLADATVLAAAGLARLGLSDRATGFLDPDAWLPAVGQGVIAVVARTDDAVTRRRLAGIDHRDTAMALAAERAYLAVLDGSCRTPIGGLARIASGVLAFRGIIVTPDGRTAHEIELRGPVAEAERIGADAGADLARRGGPDFFKAP